MTLIRCIVFKLEAQTDRQIDSDYNTLPVVRVINIIDPKIVLL